MLPLLVTLHGGADYTVSTSLLQSPGPTPVTVWCLPKASHTRAPLATELFTVFLDPGLHLPLPGSCDTALLRPPGNSGVQMFLLCVFWGLLFLCPGLKTDPSSFHLRDSVPAPPQRAPVLPDLMSHVDDSRIPSFPRLAPSPGFQTGISSFSVAAPRVH